MHKTMVCIINNNYVSVTHSSPKSCGKRPNGKKSFRDSCCESLTELQKRKGKLLVGPARAFRPTRIDQCDADLQNRGSMKSMNEMSTINFTSAKNNSVILTIFSVIITLHAHNKTTARPELNNKMPI